MAGPKPDCFQKASACFRSCSKRDGFVDSWMCAMDCELELAKCMKDIIKTTPVSKNE